VVRWRGLLLSAGVAEEARDRVRQRRKGAARVQPEAAAPAYFRDFRRKTNSRNLELTEDHKLPTISVNFLSKNPPNNSSNHHLTFVGHELRVTTILAGGQRQSGPASLQRAQASRRFAIRSCWPAGHICERNL